MANDKSLTLEEAVAEFRNGFFVQYNTIKKVMKSFLFVNIWKAFEINKK